ncbi:hypothetical protein UA32_12295 [Photobacterium angustum]|uniref:DUF1566 domain-containing protein n=1 Tax=Photobacterium angustum TaxID=661 RepID=A0ABX5GYG1_PHOAN|nr:DUF1566 domain-containing protein [Photobacterium angustum]KJG37731.1 hypothetical protein UA32_12295 [Photobacterium angustum]PSX03934.1 DUF1566 domain-containing protein [Photobacterium angustum]
MSVYKKISKTVLSVAISTVLLGCGGGGDDDLKEPKSDKEVINPPAPDGDTEIQLTLPETITLQEPKEGVNTIDFEIKIDTPAPYNFDIDYELIDGSASQSGDHKNFSKSEQKITFLEGQNTAKGRINLHQNNVYESETNFFIKIKSVNDEIGTSKITFDDEEKSIVTIRNTTHKPTITVPLAFQTMVEGVTDNLTFVVDNYSSSDITLSLQITGSVSNSDYIFNNDKGLEVTLPAYTNSLSVPITINNDALPEGGEKLTFTIASVIGAETDEDNNKVDIFIPGSYGLNDSGVLTFFNGSTFDNKSSPLNYPNQDAKYGNDSVKNNTPAHGGFSFVKLDVNGNTLNPSATNFACIKDSRTGLYVEVKTSPTNPALSESMFNWRSSNYTYNWYEKDSKLNGGSAGAVGDAVKEGDVEKGWLYNDHCAFLLPKAGETKPKNCNTHEYLAELNRRAMCGVNDWRLPTPSEIRSVYNYAPTVEAGSIDYFPNILDPNNRSSTVLTASTSVDNTGSAWCFDLADGSNKLCHKGLANMIIAVRDGEQ